MDLFQFIDDDIAIEGSIFISDNDVTISPATEGQNWDTAKMIHEEDVKKARTLLKEAKKLIKKNRPVEDYIEAKVKLYEAYKMIDKMKTKVDNMPEAVSIGDKLRSYFTPIFTLMPSEEITGFIIVPTGNNNYYIRYTTRTYVDHMSSNTGSSVKRRLQEKFNLFLHNLDVNVKAVDSLIKKSESSKSKPAKESDVSSEDNIPKGKDTMQVGNVEDGLEGSKEKSDEDEEDSEVAEAMEGVFLAALEGTLTAAERRAIPDNQFAIPETRSYPLNDESHIRSAISYFRYVPADKRKSVADAIVKRMKELHIPLKFGSKLVISKYVPSEYVVESDEREFEPKKKK